MKISSSAEIFNKSNCNFSDVMQVRERERERWRELTNVATLRAKLTRKYLEILSQLHSLRKIVPSFISLSLFPRLVFFAFFFSLPCFLHVYITKYAIFEQKSFRTNCSKRLALTRLRNGIYNTLYCREKLV